MPEVYKRLGAVAPIDDREYLLYVTPNETQSLISNITVTNRSSSPTSFDINVYESGVTQQSDLDDFYLFVAVSSGVDTATSTDGITWTQGTLPVSAGWDLVTYGDGTFVSLAYPQLFATSTDGITWTQGTLPVGGLWASVTYGDGTFVAVAGGSGGSQIAATSTDGITWTQRTLPVSALWVSVTYEKDVKPIPSEDYLFNSYNILGNETITIKGGYTMEEENTIRIKSTNGTSTFHAFGGEI